MIVFGFFFFLSVCAYFWIQYYNIDNALCLSLFNQHELQHELYGKELNCD